MIEQAVEHRLAANSHQRLPWVRELLRQPYARSLVAQFAPEIDVVVADAVDALFVGEALDLFATTARLSLFAAMTVVTPMSLRSATKDIQLAGAAVMESLRLFPPAPVFMRSVRADEVQVGPYRLRKGLRLLIGNRSTAIPTTGAIRTSSSLSAGTPRRSPPTLTGAATSSPLVAVRVPAAARRSRASSSARRSTACSLGGAGYGRRHT